MLDSIPDLRRLVSHAQNTDRSRPREISSLRALAAPFLLLAAADSTRQQLEQDEGRPPGAPGRIPPALAWGPALVAPVAAAAQLAHSNRPSESTAAATRVLNAASIGIGLATLASSLYTARATRVPSLAPLAFAAAGLLGIILDRHERLHEDERRRLARRASVVERLVPKRKRKLDHIVLHI